MRDNSEYVSKTSKLGHSYLSLKGGIFSAIVDIVIPAISHKESIKLFKIYT